MIKRSFLLSCECFYIYALTHSDLEDRRIFHSDSVRSRSHFDPDRLLRSTSECGKEFGFPERTSSMDKHHGFRNDKRGGE